MKNVIDKKTDIQLGTEFQASLERKRDRSVGISSYHGICALVDFIRIVGAKAFGNTLGIISEVDNPDDAAFHYHKMLRQADLFDKPGCNSLLWHLLNIPNDNSFYNAIEEVCFDDRKKKIDNLINEK